MSKDQQCIPATVVETCISGTPSQKNGRWGRRSAGSSISGLMDILAIPPRTIVDKLSASQQSRLRRLQQNMIPDDLSPWHRARGSVTRTTSVSAPGDDDTYGPGRRHWKGAMKYVVIGIRSTDAITNSDRLKDRKLTYWHGLKIKKDSKARLTFANNNSLRTRCMACIRIVEQQTREVAQKTTNGPQEVGGAAEPESALAEDYTIATPENIDVVFGLFHSVPEVVDLDSIHKRQLFLELRIRHFVAGSTVFEQWEKHTMIGVILEGGVRLESKHSGVPFQAGMSKIGEVIGSIMPSTSKWTATCTEATTLLCCNTDRFAAIVTDSACAERIAKKEFLKRNSVFSTLADDELNTLEPLFTTITLDDNQVLCTEGSRADHVYVVRRGFLRVYKAFLPMDRPCPRRPSRATSRSASRRTFVKNGTEPGENGSRLRFFDLGEIGPKDILGENGVLRLETSTTVASAPALVAATPALLPDISSNQEAGGDSSRSKKTRADGRPDGDVGRGQDTPLLMNAATADDSSSGVSAVLQRAAYIVSAAASGGQAEVYVAKTHGLKKLQTNGFRYSWKTAQRLHQARAQSWGADVLAHQLRRQMKWEAIKRDVVSQAEAS